MSELFILQNQHKLFLSKQNSWVDGQDVNLLYKSPYKDEAINQMVEVSAKDYTQRIKLVRCAVNDKGLPDIDPSILPEPLPTSGDIFASQDQAFVPAQDGESAELVESQASQG